MDKSGILGSNKGRILDMVKSGQLRANMTK